jgi:peroxiredoxin
LKISQTFAAVRHVDLRTRLRTGGNSLSVSPPQGEGMRSGCTQANYKRRWVGILVTFRWAILFSHPADFTPVCTTELGCVAQLDEEFSQRGVKMIALSCDDVESHKNWIKDVNAYSGKDEFPYPIIADPKREIAVQLGLIDPDEKDSKGLPLTCRSVS